MEGWIKIYRKLLEQPWYSDTVMVRLFLHLLLTADMEGSLKTTYRELSRVLSIPISTVHRKMVRLEKESMVSVGSSRSQTVIHITNYVRYQQPPGRERPRKEEQPNPKRFIPPTLGMVRMYCEERGNSVDAEAFVSFYQSQGWKVGRNQMKDWRAAVRTWEKRENKTRNGTAKQDINARQYADGAEAIERLLQRGAAGDGEEVP